MLSDTQALNAKPLDRPYKLSDAAGLYLFVRPTGSKQWRFDYSYNSKRKTLTIGTYPYTSLKEARRSLENAKTALEKNIDPALRPLSVTFKDVAEEWLRKLEKEGDDPKTMEKKRWLLSYAYPVIASRPIPEITAPELLRILRKLESSGKYESAKRLRSNLSRIFRYAIATARAERDPAADLKGALIAPQAKHHAAFTKPDDIRKLLISIDAYPGSQTIAFALQFLALTFVRPGELRAAEWTELKDHEWLIPAHKMKMKHPHVVPLSRQARRILDANREINGHARYIFPSLHSSVRAISENTLNTALRRIGFSKDEMTSHGFRTMASTRLNEMNWHPDAIEAQLAHQQKNQVRAAYNQAQYLDIRRPMMQAWADYLEELMLSHLASRQTAGS